MSVEDDDIQTRESLGLRDYLKVIRERFWVIPATVALVLAITLIVSLLSTPQYRASTRLLYQKNNLEQYVFGSQTFTNSNQQRDVQTGAELVKLQPVADKVHEELGSSRSVSSLLGMVSIKSDASTNVIDIITVGPDANETAAVANSFANQFILSQQEADRSTVEAARQLVNTELNSLSAADKASDYGVQLKEKLDNLRIIEAMQNGGFTVRQEAAVPTAPFSPKPLRDSLVAIVLGIVAGVGLAFLLDYLDRRVKDEKAVERALGAPVLAKAPLIGGRRRGY